MVEQWHVIEAYPRADALAARYLSEFGVETFRPMRTVYRADRRARSRRPIHTKGATRAEMEAPRFAPFVFVRCDVFDSVETRWRIERLETRWGDRLVQRFLCGAGTNNPAVIPQAMIDFYRDKAIFSRAMAERFEIGQCVEMTAGPFKGFVGEVTQVDMRGWLTVEIQLFGCSTPCFIEVEHVRPSEMCLT